jgi:hypothetical protein
METIKYVKQELSCCSKKSKPFTVLLAMLCPGAGHLYLGELSRAIWFIILFATNSLFFLYALTSIDNFRTPIIVFLSLIVGVVYIMNIFGALQQVNLVNIMDRLQYFSEDSEEGGWS